MSKREAARPAVSNRRGFIKSAGAATVVGVLAGCTGGGDGGGGDGGDGGDGGTVAVTTPGR